MFSATQSLFLHWILLNSIEKLEVVSAEKSVPEEGLEGRHTGVYFSLIEKRGVSFSNFLCPTERFIEQIPF